MYPKFASWKVFAILLPVFAVGQYYFLQENLAMQNYEFVEHFQPVLFAIIAISGCAFMANIAFIIQRYDVMKVLRMIGYHSLCIYVFTCVGGFGREGDPGKGKRDVCSADALHHPAAGARDPYYFL